MEVFKDRIDKNNIPKHVAIIMDGNGRWAEKHGRARMFGHEHGVESVRSVVEGADEIGIKYLTLYAFSTENWARPKDEVNALMALLVQAIENETNNLLKNNVRLKTIGNIADLPEMVRMSLQKSIDKLKNNTGLTLVLALSYSGRWDIVNALKQIAGEVKKDRMNPDEINDIVFSKYMSTAEIPDPELLIRTSGEYRVSNFLLWEIAYSELFYTSKLWPDFRKEDLWEALVDYQGRERRFGKTREQITN